MSQLASHSQEELDQLVKEADLGGREPGGTIGQALAVVAGLWSLFQVWYASPLPFALGFGIFNDTEARAIHLAFSIFLGFCAFPAFKSSSRQVIPWSDWLLACVGAFCGAYLFTFYNQLALRPGAPTTQDIVIGVMGVVIMLEATRRSMGIGMLITTGLFILFVFTGPYMPDVLQHRGASLSRFISHMWLTTEGVYGVALGVSVQFIFLFVLFGTLLDIAGAGNYMLQVSLATLGHLRGGPAKVAVVSSALNGVVSGSSVSNVVSGGIFTIPLMKRTGYSGVKAGAIEAASSVNGQIMPPVMGAAAFLMVEYVGIPYSEIVKHAALPAILSYIGLFYIVHLEALKLGMEPLVRREPRPWRDRLLRTGLGVSGSIAVVVVLYYALQGTKAVLGEAAPWAVGAIVVALYLYAIRASALSPDLPGDIDVDNPRVLDTWPTVRAGLHYLLPIGALIWCLMIEEMSPALSAFWAIVILMALMLTQGPLVALWRGQSLAGTWKKGGCDVMLGFHDGARNMIGIGIATATAGIIVGGITLTGLGLRMTEFV
ncbi:MAG: TRAP transporter permease, partial [Betaproteobacteria bacterium]|nr:TRAP transporter permease [Betaproteobacteria bacterium]